MLLYRRWCCSPEAELLPCCQLFRLLQRPSFFPAHHSFANLLTGLLSHCPCSAQRVPGTTEIAKKGTLRVDLQALTVGVALLAMHRWLVRLPARSACLEMKP